MVVEPLKLSLTAQSLRLILGEGLDVPILYPVDVLRRDQHPAAQIHKTCLGFLQVVELVRNNDWKSLVKSINSKRVRRARILKEKSSQIQPGQSELDLHEVLAS